jgi:hypothetical protein
MTSAAVLNRAGAFAEVLAVEDAEDAGGIPLRAQDMLATRRAVRSRSAPALDLRGKSRRAASSGKR